MLIFFGLSMLSAANLAHGVKQVSFDYYNGMSLNFKCDYYPNERDVCFATFKDGRVSRRFKILSKHFRIQSNFNIFAFGEVKDPNSLMLRIQLDIPNELDWKAEYELGIYGDFRLGGKNLELSSVSVSTMIDGHSKERIYIVAPSTINAIEDILKRLENPDWTN